jgi:hypothetical protein
MYKKIQNRAVWEALPNIWLCNWSIPNFLMYEENLISFFISVASTILNYCILRIFYLFAKPFFVLRRCYILTSSTMFPPYTWYAFWLLLNCENFGFIWRWFYAVCGLGGLYSCFASSLPRVLYADITCRIQVCKLRNPFHHSLSLHALKGLLLTLILPGPCWLCLGLKGTVQRDGSGRN